MAHRILLFSCLIILISATGCGSGVSFFHLSGPEKYWVVKHPFIARKAREIMIEAKNQSKLMESDKRLDGDPDGGQVDAFRHSYWLARLSQQMKTGKALALGVAHEKNARKNFEKKKAVEENSVQDSIASVMDLYNNSVGARVGSNNKTLQREPLKQLLVDMILKGEMKKILKSPSGLPLNCNRRILDSTEYVGRWNNMRCLIFSDQ